MSLYDDDDDPAKVGSWSDSIKLLQGSLQAKKFHQQQQQKKDASKTVIAPVADLRKKRTPVLPRNPNTEVTFNSITGKMEIRESSSQSTTSTTTSLVNDLSGPPSSVTALIQNITSSMSVFGYTDEYDPSRPNDYEKLKAQQQPPPAPAPAPTQMKPKGLYDDDDDDDDQNDEIKDRMDEQDDETKDRPVRKGNAFAPPPSLIEEDKRAGVNEPAEDNGDFSLTDNDRSDEMEIEPMNTNLGGFGAKKGAAAVAKMMAKMGYREGQGLGKSQQGMSSALIVEKTSKRGGKILHEKDLPVKEPFLPPPPPPPPVPAVPKVDIAAELKNATKVVLLKNMVGPGEVDDLLDSETKEECQKYGEVEKCLIYEIPDAPEDEAVRIFVEFKRVESAIKAVVAMNGRYFGGRVVKAKFYDFEKFRQFDLADDS